MDVKVFSNLGELSAAAASTISDLAEKAIAERGCFMIALSGGNTPRSLYDALASDYQSAIDWEHVQLFWGDERFVPHDDPASNYRLAKETLIDHIPIPPKNIHPINTALATPEDASAAYSAELISTIGGPVPTFDLILLGLGNDGHTASLFLGMSEQEMKNGIVIATHSPVVPFDRISLTLSVINNARNVCFLVAGEEKKEILKAVLSEAGSLNSKYPAAHVNPHGELVWFVDDAVSA